MTDSFARNTSGSFNKISSDLKYNSQIPYHSQALDYLQKRDKDRDVQQFQLHDSPKNKIIEGQSEENTNGGEDSLEYRSLLPSQDFIFSHSKKSTEAKDMSKYSINHHNSSFFKNLPETRFSDFKDIHKSNAKELHSNNKGNNDDLSYSNKFGISNNSTATAKLWDSSSGVDGKNYNDVNTFKNPSQFYEKQNQDSLVSPDYLTSGGGLNQQDAYNNYTQKNIPTFQATTPTKDSTRYYRSNSEYQYSKQKLFDEDDDRFLKNRSASQSKYNVSANKSSIQWSKAKDSIPSYRLNEEKYAGPQQASFRNPTDFYNMQKPDNQYHSAGTNSFSYSASVDRKRPYSNYSTIVETFVDQKEKDNDILKKRNQDLPYYSFDKRNNKREQVNDYKKDSSDLLYEMKEKQQIHQQRLQDILRDSYEKHQKQTEDFYYKKQLKDIEIQKQYEQLTKFGQSTSHFNNLDPIPDISEIKDLSNSNISGFIHKESQDQYTPASSAQKNPYHYNRNEANLPQEQNGYSQNSKLKNSNSFMSGQKQNKGRRDYYNNNNSYILEIDDSLNADKNNSEQQNQFNQANFEQQQKEIDSLRRRIQDDETERKNQQKIQREQLKRIELLEHEIQNLTLRLKDAKNQNSTPNSSQQHIKENLSQSYGPSSQQMKQSKSESQTKNNYLKVINNYEPAQSLNHNCGSGMTFNDEQKFRFKIIELLQVENDEEIIQSIKKLISYKKQNEGFTKCVINTFEQVVPPGYCKNKKPNLQESWKFIKQMMQQYITLSQERNRLKSLAKQLSEVITKGLDAENEDLQNSIRNILIL